MNTEQLAEELHRFYRAAFKALSTDKDGTAPAFTKSKGHDHGWDHCNKKKYFLKRAERMREEGLPVTPTFTGIVIENGTYAGRQFDDCF